MSFHRVKLLRQESMLFACGRPSPLEIDRTGRIRVALGYEYSCLQISNQINRFPADLGPEQRRHISLVAIRVSKNASPVQLLLSIKVRIALLSASALTYDRHKVAIVLRRPVTAILYL